MLDIKSEVDRIVGYTAWQFRSMPEVDTLGERIFSVPFVLPTRERNILYLALDYETLKFRSPEHGNEQIISIWAKTSFLVEHDECLLLEWVMGNIVNRMEMSPFNDRNAAQNIFSREFANDTPMMSFYTSPDFPHGISEDGCLKISQEKK